MTKEEFEFVLAERKQKIVVMDSQWDLEHKAYLSLSGGKDSMVVHRLLDMALPGNQIPRVFINTGIEFRAVSKYVQQLAAEDPRIIMLRPTQDIQATLREKGWPFKSKDHSERVSNYQHTGSLSPSTVRYLERESFSCPDKLRYQFTPECTLPISSECCMELKKKPGEKWMRENGRTILMTGMRQAEGGQRAAHKCSTFYSKDGRNVRKGMLHKFHPVFYMTDEWMDMFVQETGLRLCELYYPPYNFKRTGCKGCPFNVRLQQELRLLEEYLPAERRQCELIWKPVYDEYRRLGYRLRDGGYNTGGGRD